MVGRVGVTPSKALAASCRLSSSTAMADFFSCCISLEVLAHALSVCFGPVLDKMHVWSPEAHGTHEMRIVIIIIIKMEINYCKIIFCF